MLSLSPAGSVRLRFLQENPTALPTLLKTLLELVLFEEIPNQWSLSRPMLPLILMDEQVFARIKVRRGSPLQKAPACCTGEAAPDDAGPPSRQRASSVAALSQTDGL